MCVCVCVLGGGEVQGRVGVGACLFTMSHLSTSEFPDRTRLNSQGKKTKKLSRSKRLQAVSFLYDTNISATS